jgi:chemotaxis signal transduction protein
VLACAGGAPELQAQLDGLLPQWAAAGPVQVVRHGQACYALGTSHSAGYREYDGQGEAARTAARAHVLLPLCTVAESVDHAPIALAPRLASAAPGDEAREVATFRVGGGWYGLPVDDVIKAVAPKVRRAAGPASRHFAGLQIVDGEPVPVFDIGLGAATAADGTGDNVVVLKNGARGRLGVLVDELGPVGRVALAQLRSLPAAVRTAETLTASVVCPTEPAGGEMLQLLDAQRIVAGVLSLPAGPDQA